MTTALPDPYTNAEMYADVPTKRLIAWGVDFLVIAAITAVLVPITLFTALFYIPFLWLMVSFLYRWVTLSGDGATWGMRFASIEIREGNGQRLDMMSAFFHTLGYHVSIAIFPLQLVSIALMLMSERKQGLTDHILGTVALNRSARMG
ncbi:RDD family protein [Dinoroseobacter sp. S76]|uniref:RDD family protein n=1 Tax=Dinoroseobacter sp. S76 TaxID=3415124 RepID=UPI003C7A9603